MSGTHEDLDEFLEKFKSLFRSQHRRKKIENDLLHLVERLCKELESSESNAKHWESCYKALLSHDNANLTTKYVALKEKYDHLELKHNNLKMEFDEMEKQYQEKLENQKNDLSRRLIESEEKYKTEVLNLNNRIESDKLCYETKEKELLNEIQASQAATALQVDDIESNLKSQIVDLNNKLKQSQTHARTLMAEIGKLRNQLANQKQKSGTLYFQETPIQAARYNLLCRSDTRDLNNFYTESAGDINSFDFQKPTSHSTNLTVSSINEENNIDNNQRNINNHPSMPLYSDKLGTQRPPSHSTNLTVGSINEENNIDNNQRNINNHPSVPLYSDKLGTQRPPSHSTNLTVGSINEENNIDSQRNINTHPSAPLYSATPAVVESAQSVKNLFTSAQTNHDQMYQTSHSGTSFSYDQNNNELTNSRVFQQKSMATPEKFQQLSCQVKTYESNIVTGFQRHTSTPIYKGKGAKRNYILPSKMPSSDNEDVKNKPRKRKLFDPDHIFLEPKE